MLPIYYIGLVQAFFAALLIRRKSGKSNADIILIVWLVSIGIEMVYSLLNLSISPWLPDLIVLPLTYGPLLYFYTHHLITNEKIRFSKWLVHYIPFFLMLILALTWSDSESIDTIDYFEQGWKTYLSFFDYFIFIVSMFWYWIIVNKRIKSYQTQLSQQLSFQNTKVRLNWVKSISWWILGAFIVSSFCYLGFVLLNIYPFNPIVIYHLGLLVFIFSISYYGIHQPLLPNITEDQWISKKYKQTFNDSELQNFGKQLESYMINNKPYLKGELTLQELADEMGDTTQKISTFLNHILDKNFFTFINDYRIQEAKGRIKDPKNKNLTLLAIGYDSGFNSKSSFNSLFKKYTELTPSEYQKKVLH